MRLHLQWHCSALISFAFLGWWWLLPTCKGFAFTTKNLPKSSLCHDHQVDFSEALHVSRRLVESTCLTLAIIASTITDDAHAATASSYADYGGCYGWGDGWGHAPTTTSNDDAKSMSDP